MNATLIQLGLAVFGLTSLVMALGHNPGPGAGRR